MKHLGDISKINGADIEPVDIITFGSPCQDLSVAGKRAGLEGARSGLFMEAVRIIKEMREATNGKYPTFALWENVPGAFSSNKGEDFRVVLEELIKISEPSAVMPEIPKKGWAYADSYVGDGWSLAYRVFDTQYWPGTPQRRKRIHLVADFRGQRARKVLFEREGLRGYLTESPPPRERVTVYVEDGPGTAGGEGENSSTVSILNSWDSQGNHVADGTGRHSFPTLRGCGGAGYQAGYVLAETEPEVTYAVATQQGGAEISDNGICPTVTAAAGMSGNNQPWICGPTTFILDNIGGQAEYGTASDVNGTLRAGVQGAIAYCYDARGNGNGSTVSTITGDHENRVTDYSSLVVYNGENITSPQNKANPHPGDPSHTLGTDSRNYLVYCLQGNGIDRADTAGCNGKGWKEDTSYTLNTVDRPAVCFAVDQGGGKSGANVHNDLSPTLTCTHGGEPAVAYGIETFHCATEEEKVPTLKARDWKDPHVVTYGVDCRNMNEYSELYPTLQAKPNGGQSLNFSGAVRTSYVVRRLTPTECARLQGFSDKWGHPDHKDDLTDEEYRFWLDVRNTHAAINGKAVKEYTRDQMLTWYNKLHSDSAEYKMWGNGIALPPALYCMQGMAEVLSGEERF